MESGGEREETKPRSGRERSRIEGENRSGGRHERKAKREPGEPALGAGAVRGRQRRVTGGRLEQPLCTCLLCDVRPPPCWVSPWGGHPSSCVACGQPLRVYLERKRKGRHILGIKPTDFSEGCGREGRGVVRDGVQVSGFYSQWMVVPLAEMGRDGGLPRLGYWTRICSSGAQMRGLWLGWSWRVGSRGIQVGDPHQKHVAQQYSWPVLIGVGKRVGSGPHHPELKRRWDIRVMVPRRSDITAL